MCVRLLCHLLLLLLLSGPYSTVDGTQLPAAAVAAAVNAGSHSAAVYCRLLLLLLLRECAAVWGLV